MSIKDDSDKGYVSNTTMDLYNNDTRATAGDIYFRSATQKPPEAFIDEIKAKFISGDLWAWTPANANVVNHHHILK